MVNILFWILWLVRFILFLLGYWSGPRAAFKLRVLAADYLTGFLFAGGPAAGTG